MFVAFADATQAVAACVQAQRALSSHPWPPDGVVRVRMGLHTGIAAPTAEGEYVAVAVHQTTAYRRRRPRRPDSGVCADCRSGGGVSPHGCVAGGPWAFPVE